MMPVQRVLFLLRYKNRWCAMCENPHFVTVCADKEITRYYVQCTTIIQYSLSGSLQLTSHCVTRLQKPAS